MFKILTNIFTSKYWTRCVRIDDDIILLAMTIDDGGVKERLLTPAVAVTRSVKRIIFSK